MIVKDYIKQFEKYGFGMFVHFGLYSIYAKGEWAKKHNLDFDGYEDLKKQFNPEPDWAKRLVDTAKKAGCRYITITTRHHDGFALYDTCGTSDFDAPHSLAGRDLIAEFVDECRKADIVPFFYHTIIDWHEKSYDGDMDAYLKFLRDSIEILCTRYGKIGGFWFDGMWAKPGFDWEEDKLYGVIRKHQPDAMIINNTGLDAQGALGHIELDSVTFERGRPRPINMPGAPKYIASEMCQILNQHWGFTARDFHYNSLTNIIEDLCVCRRYGANFLLNVGPMGNGLVRPLDDAMLRTLGEWVEIHKEALYLPRPSGIEVNREGDRDFILDGEDCKYYFAHDIAMCGSEHVAPGAWKGYSTSFKLDKKIKSVAWIDSGEAVEFEQNGDEVVLKFSPQNYGYDLVVKIAKIICE